MLTASGPDRTSTRLAADHALPQRDWLLDAGAVSEWFGVPAELIRVKYRLGESLRVLYRLGSAGRANGPDHLVAGRTFPAGTAERVAARAGRAVPGRPPPLADPRRDVVWWTFPDDRRLAGVGRFLGGPEHGTVVQYAPERSVTLRMGPAETPSSFVKVYAPGTADPQRLAARYQLVATRLAAHGLSSPRPLGWGRDSLVLQPMPGGPWLRVAPARLGWVMGQLGRMIGEVHRTPVDDRARIDVTDFVRLGPARLERSAALVAQAVPSVSELALDLGRRLVSTHRSTSAAVLLHGDCHPGNVLVSEDAVSLVDFDQAGLGAPAADLGSLVARLRYGGAVGERHGDLAGTLVARVLDGYAGVRRLPGEADLRWHTAAALLAERALRAVNRVRPEGLDVLEDVLLGARSILDGGDLA